MLACNEDKTRERNCRILGLRELARTRHGELQGVQMTGPINGVEWQR